MPMHQGLIPREGFCADVLFKLFGSTALNPSLLIPVLLLARYTKRGSDLSILHPGWYKTVKTLLYVALARRANSWYSDRIRNNGVKDKYRWGQEIVLITGGAGGIGGAMVKLFEEVGATVVVLDIQPMTFAHSSKVHHFRCDITSPSNIAAVAADITSTIGHPTVVINNAGVARGKTILNSDPADIRFTFDVNTLAPFYIVKTFLPHMIATNHGTVVNVASCASFLATPSMVDYAASKAALLSLHEGLTAELTTHYRAPKVRTIVVHPGHVRTELFEGYDLKTQFVLPPLDPRSMAEAVVRKVFSGTSGSVILPKAGNTLPLLRILPDWYTIPLRAKVADSMTNFRGRQVVPDVSRRYDGKEGQSSESTVLV